MAFTLSPAGGRRSSSSLIRSRRPTQARRRGDAAIRAPMGGLARGRGRGRPQRVEAGQRLAVVEAMKMEHALIAPYAGLVRDLDANVGDQVEMGARIHVGGEGGRTRGARKSGRGEVTSPVEF